MRIAGGTIFLLYMFQPCEHLFGLTARTSAILRALHLGICRSVDRLRNCNSAAKPVEMTAQHLLSASDLLPIWRQSERLIF